jgi:hypothetical protein
MTRAGQREEPQRDKGCANPNPNWVRRKWPDILTYFDPWRAFRSNGTPIYRLFDRIVDELEFSRFTNDFRLDLNDEIGFAFLLDVMRKQGA